MKNEQQNTQNVKQDQNAATNQGPSNQQQNGNIPKQGNSEAAAQKSNISIDNEGKISKDDKWKTGAQPGQQEKNIFQNQHREDNSTEQKSDRVVTEPEIDAPVYEPEKTEKKMPQMGSNKNSK